MQPNSPLARRPATSLSMSTSSQHHSCTNHKAGNWIVGVHRDNSNFQYTTVNAGHVMQMTLVGPTLVKRTIDCHSSSNCYTQHANATAHAPASPLTRPFAVYTSSDFRTYSVHGSNASFLLHPVAAAAINDVQLSAGAALPSVSHVDCCAAFSLLFVKCSPRTRGSLLCAYVITRTAVNARRCTAEFRLKLTEPTQLHPPPVFSIFSDFERKSPSRDFVCGPAHGDR